MPLKYVIEMVMDRIAASKVYKGKDYTNASPWEYFAKGRTILSFTGDESSFGEASSHAQEKGGEKNLRLYALAAQAGKGILIRDTNKEY